MPDRSRWELIKQDDGEGAHWVWQLVEPDGRVLQVVSAQPLVVEPGSRWHFARHHHGDERSWVWQLIGPDGRVQRTSPPHWTYGKAVYAAVQSGFKPAEHRWSVDLPSGLIHFPQGDDPSYLERRSGVLVGAARVADAREGGGAKKGPA